MKTVYLSLKNLQQEVNTQDTISSKFLNPLHRPLTTIKKMVCCLTESKPLFECMSELLKARNRPDGKGSSSSGQY